jgi:cytochrome b
MTDPVATPDKAPAPLIWDLPLRLFHWGLAAAIAVSLYTGLRGGFEEMDWHQTSGFVVLGLVLFRLAWGWLGTRHARFQAFLRGPGPVLAWARQALTGRPPAAAGHNPLAGWVITAMLLVIAVQAGTGLFASDDLFVEGPLVDLVESDTVSLATSIHGWGPWTVGSLVALHLFGLLVHRLWFGERLVLPMITGRKADAQAADGVSGQRLLIGTATAAVSAAVVWWVVNRL